ncbi:MAG: hypothetical protein ACKO25_00945 [Cyanobium sp.]
MGQTDPQQRRAGTGPGEARPLLRLRYRTSIADAVADLGQLEEIGEIFASFQLYLYASAPAPLG